MGKAKLLSWILGGLLTTTSVVYVVSKNLQDSKPEEISYDLPEEVEEKYWEDQEEEEYFSPEQKKKVKELFTFNEKLSKPKKVLAKAHQALVRARGIASKIQKKAKAISKKKTKNSNKDSENVTQAETIEIEATEAELEVLTEELEQLAKTDESLREPLNAINNIKQELSKTIHKDEKGKTSLDQEQLDKVLEKLPLPHVEQGKIAAHTAVEDLDKINNKTSYLPNISLIRSAYANLPLSCQSNYVATVDNPQSQSFVDVNSELVALDSEMVNLARDLGSSKKIFEYVRDNIEYYPTFGFTQNAKTLFKTRTGNAYDKASLLISLLRSKGIPARYVIGEVWISGDKLKKVWDLENDTAVLNYYLRVLRERYRDNIDTNPDRIYRWVNGKRYFLLPHAWVEAYTTLSKNDDLTWKALDPSFSFYRENLKNDKIEDLYQKSLDLDLELFSYEDFLFSPDSTGKIIKRETSDLFVMRRLSAVIRAKESEDLSLASYLEESKKEIKQDANVALGPYGEEACVFNKVAAPDLSYFPKRY